MPKSRTRVRYCDCRECDDFSNKANSNSGASVYQDAFSTKCLILFATNVKLNQQNAEGGFKTELGNELETQYLDSISREGGSGVLTVHPSVCSGGTSEIAELSLAQLLGVLQDYKNTKDSICSLPSLQDKFQGMKCEVISTLGETCTLSKRCKLVATHISATNETKSVVQRVRHSLDRNDLIILHVDESNLIPLLEMNAIEWIDGVVEGLRSVDGIDDVMIVIIVGPIKSDYRKWSLLMDGYMIQRPRQSIEKSRSLIVDFDRDFHFLCSRRLRGSVRVDDRDRFLEVSRFDAYNAISIDRLIPEIAYQIGRSSKFGS